jgi:hypothetical protein
VEIPPLSMVDDVLCVAECGFKTSMAHGYMKMKTVRSCNLGQINARSCMLEKCVIISNVRH